jgi:toxin-antitoxin system PIN domain toxin
LTVIALLDVSILIALFDADHVHHQLAHDWFEDQRENGWATCPLTENGFVRVASNASLFDPPKRPADAIEDLIAFRGSGYHHFWPDAISITDEEVFLATMIRGHKQVSDAYLLGLATRRRGAFATLDQSIPVSAVSGATRSNLLVITAARGESRPGDN